VVDYTAIWDSFIDEVDIYDIQTPEELAEALDKWLSPNVGRKHPERREHAIEVLTEDFWQRRVELAETLPERLTLEFFPETPEKRPLIQTAIERALRFPAEESARRFGAFYGTLSGAIRRGEISAEEVRDLYRYLLGKL